MSASSAGPASRALAVVLRRFGALLALALMSVLLSIVSEHFLTIDNLINVFRQSAVNSLLALGQLAVIITGGIDLSVGSILGFCCVLAAWMLKTRRSRMAGDSRHTGRRNGTGRDQRAAVYQAAPASSLYPDARDDERCPRTCSGDLRRVRDLGTAGRFPVLGCGGILYIPVPIFVVLALCGVFHVFLRTTTPGRDLYAIGGNAQAALFSGVPVSSRLNLVYSLSGLMAAIAAIVLAGRMNSGFPLAGVGSELDSIAAVIIGGASFFGGVARWGNARRCADHRSAAERTELAGHFALLAGRGDRPGYRSGRLDRRAPATCRSAPRPMTADECQVIGPR